MSCIFISQPCLDHVVSSVIVLHCFRSQSNSFWRPNTFLFCMLISFILQCFENVFCKIYFKENLEKYTKGLCERFLLKGRNSSYNKKCQRRQCLENRPIIASCVQAKRRSEIPSLTCFPSAEKIPVLTALVVRCSKHAGRKFHLTWWQGWNQIPLWLLTLVCEHQW